MIEKMMANVVVAAPIQSKSSGHCSFKKKFEGRAEINNV
jgi:hypothetical protein